MVDSPSLFSNPDMVVSLLVPNMQNESVSYKYLKEQARDFARRSSNPSEFVSLVTAELSREKSRTRREALFQLKQRATELFALDDRQSDF
jgi:hypothetical protein